MGYDTEAIEFDRIARQRDMPGPHIGGILALHVSENEAKQDDYV